MPLTPTDPAKAQIWLRGEAPNQILDVYVPRGARGEIGPVGPQGPAVPTTMTVLETTTGPETPGATGPQGPQGLKGDPGGIVDGTELGATNLNLITASGIYKQTTSANAAPENNYPFSGIMAIMTVFKARPTDVFQIIEPGNGIRAGNVSYKRASADSGATWSAWRAQSTHRVSDTAGRAIYAWDDILNREQIIYGDTGWRDVSASLLGGATGTLLIRRVGQVVDLSASLSFPEATASGTSFYALPGGFQSSFFRGYYATRPTSNAAIQLHVRPTVNNLYLGCPSPWSTAWGVLEFSLSFTVTTNWPSTLPGTASGSIPNL